jgi:hypothetical protein
MQNCSYYEIDKNNKKHEKMAKMKIKLFEIMIFNLFVNLELIDYIDQ